MNTNYVSATELKRNVSEILNSVYYKKSVTIVEKFGKPIAKIIPIDAKELGSAEIEEVLKSTFGSIPDFPDVKSSRYFRKPNINL